MGIDGYWSPHTSSIDFCEPNYLITNYIAETHNVWSSLYLIFLAYIGFKYCNLTYEWRIWFMFLGLFVVGFGSASLHGKKML
jgi:dihydroceramidase